MRKKQQKSQEESEANTSSEMEEGKERGEEEEEEVEEVEEDEDNEEEAEGSKDGGSSDDIQVIEDDWIGDHIEKIWIWLFTNSWVHQSCLGRDH